MINKIFKNQNQKYCFTINNTFHILYFLAITKKYNLQNTIFLINNTNNFFTKWWYDKICDNNKINYIILPWENYFRQFPYSIIDVIKYKKQIKNKLKNITWYKLIVSQDSTISNSIILKYLALIDNDFLALIDTTAYSIIKDKNYWVKYLLYKLYLKILWVNRWIKSWEYFSYEYKIYSNDLDKTILKEQIWYLKQVFSKKLDKLENIKSNKNVIFLSQNIIDEYWINKDTFINKLENIKQYYNKQWYEFYIKPHPLENTSYYENQFNLIDKFIPSELLDIYFWDKNTIYITFFSTVINNLNFWQKYLIWDLWFWDNEKQIIKLLNRNFNIPFLQIK